MTRVATAALVLALCLAAPLLPKPAAPEHGGNGHWRVGQDPPRVVTVSDNTLRGDVWREAILHEIAVYNDAFAAVGVPITLVYGDPPDDSCDKREGKIVVCSQTSDGDWRGWVNADSGQNHHFDWATVHLNDRFYGDIYGFPADHVARKSILCHELGHAFGQGHSSDPGSTCLNHDDGNFHDTEPGEHDRAELARVYSHDHGGGP